MPRPTRYSRVVLKISGESFAKPGQMGVDQEELALMAREIAAAASDGTQIAVVVGGGNIIRGAHLARAGQIDQSTADYMGMLGTVINGMALREALSGIGQECRLMSALDIPAVGERFIRQRALRRRRCAPARRFAAPDVGPCPAGRTSSVARWRAAWNARPADSPPGR